MKNNKIIKTKISSTITQSKSSSPTNLTSSKTQKQSEQIEQFLYIKDNRTQQQKDMHNKVAEQIYQSNLRRFRIQLTVKNKVVYKPSKLFRVDLGNDWYAMITDNQVKSQFAVLTLHGAPGDHRQWAGLETQMKQTIRWINLIIPGFDGLDERRGNYTGSVDDLSKLIVLLLEERKVAKIIYVGHSLGSIFGSYFITKHPELVCGYMNITGIVNYWYTGLLTFYRSAIFAYGFGPGPHQAAMMRLLNKNQFRQKHHQKFISDTRQFAFLPEKVPFPELTVTEMCAYIKLIGSLPQGCSQFYAYNHKLKLLRMLIFGKNDPLHQIDKTNQQIYSITRGRFKFDGYYQNQKLIVSMKKQLQETIFQLYGIRIQTQKIQDYFCYHFDDTGHNAHKRRPKEISKILRLYIVVVKVMQKYKQVIQSKL